MENIEEPKSIILSAKPMKEEKVFSDLDHGSPNLVWTQTFSYISFLCCLQDKINGKRFVELCAGARWSSELEQTNNFLLGMATTVVEVLFCYLIAVLLYWVDFNLLHFRLRHLQPLWTAKHREENGWLTSGANRKTRQLLIALINLRSFHHWEDRFLRM